jgi:hypothetical protein
VRVKQPADGLSRATAGGRAVLLRPKKRHGFSPQFFLGSDPPALCEPRVCGARVTRRAEVIGLQASRYFVASRSVTPEARALRGVIHADTSSGRFLLVSRRIQPMALRMKNSLSPSIASA